MTTAPNFETKLASSAAEIEAAQRLRYDVFVRELGGSGALVDHENGLERDEFDPFVDHLLLLDTNRGSELQDQVVGVYRLLRRDQAVRAGGFYSASEFNLDVLVNSGKTLLELGRSCLHADYRGGAGMFVLWAALADYVADHAIDILFGVASFHGTDLATLAPSLGLLHERHLAPPELRTRAQEAHYEPLNRMDMSAVDKRKAMLGVPSLIKAYLRLGGYVGDGAYVDHAFNTTDVCLILDTARMNTRQKSIYTKGREVT
jgi:putative hemolysin